MTFFSEGNCFLQTDRLHPARQRRHQSHTVSHLMVLLFVRHHWKSEVSFLEKWIRLGGQNTTGPASVFLGKGGGATVRA